MAYTNVLTSPANTSIVKAKSTRSRNVNNKALASNVATLTTSANHNFVSGESVVVSGVDATFNGTYTITSTPTLTTFTYSKTAGDVASQAATGTAVVSQTANLQEWQNSSGTVGARITSSQEFSNTGGQSNSEIFGSSALVLGQRAVSVGNLATAHLDSVAIGYNARTSISDGQYTVMIGSGAYASAQTGTAIGYNATTINGVAIGRGAIGNSVAIGNNANAAGNSVVIGQTASGTDGNQIIIGNNATCGAGQANIFIGHSTSKSGNLTNTIVIGNNASSTASQQIVIGSNTMTILNGYFGKGVTNTIPTSFTLNATGGSGTDIGGSTLLLAGGRGTGAGVGGSVILQTSSVGTTGSTLQTLVNRLTINNSGNVLVNGFTSSTVGLTVRGAASQTANLQEW
jgi:hypothetical protein